MAVMRRGFARAVAVVLGSLAAATPALADGYVAPFIGGNFGGDSGSRLVGATRDASPLTVGITAGVMGGGIFGVEGDASFTPNFYGYGGPYRSSRLFTATANLVAGVPIGGQGGPGLRPYASAGLGLIRRQIDAVLDVADSSEDSLGYSLGVGMMGFFSDHLGVRADLRYLRSLQRTDENSLGFEPGHFSYSRGSVGVVVRF